MDPYLLIHVVQYLLRRSNGQIGSRRVNDEVWKGTSARAYRLLRGLGHPGGMPAVPEEV